MLSSDIDASNYDQAIAAMQHDCQVSTVKLKVSTLRHYNSGSDVPTVALLLEFSAPFPVTTTLEATLEFERWVLSVSLEDGMPQ